MYVACLVLVPQLILHITGTGEHGVGVGKKEFLIDELGEGTVNLMIAIKRAVDPLWLFNPGKVIAPCLQHSL